MEINEILKRIEQRWYKKSERAEDGGEGIVNFDDLLEDVEWGLKKISSLPSQTHVEDK